MKEITDAILFAAHCHSGQFRKDGRTPYINHPIEVMHLLIHTANVTDNDILVAAVLHDVIEDTPTAPEELAEKFGVPATNLVLELTDDKFLTKGERKRIQLETAHLLSPGARLIRLSDKICNVNDILYAPPGDWKIDRRNEYLDWAEAVVNKIRGTNEALEKRFDALIREGRKILIH